MVFNEALKGYEMNRSATYRIGAPRSKARFEQAQSQLAALICGHCLKEHASQNQYIINMGSGKCFVCEEEVETGYLLLY